jgi:hypothetical protein
MKISRINSATASCAENDSAFRLEATFGNKGCAQAVTVTENSRGSFGSSAFSYERDFPLDATQAFGSESSNVIHAGRDPVQLSREH